MRYAAGNISFWLVVLFLMLGSLSASADDKFYIGLEAGFSESGDLNVSQSFINHPTRCDSLLYSSGATPPTDAECTSDKTSSFGNAFTPGAGFVGGATLGYVLGNGLRFEAEYLNRRQGSDRKLIFPGAGSNDPFEQKSSEWSEQDPPWEQVRDLSSHHFFLNAYYDLLNDSPFTPYIGGGIGVGSMEIRYSNRLLRKDDLGTEPWQVAAAGTASSVNTELGKTTLGFQVIGGVDYVLGDDLSIGAKVRWTHFSGFDRDDVLATEIRSHKPVHADGVTPYTTDFQVDDMNNWTFTVGLKYYL